MSLVIDHLQADHGVRVRCDFIDRRGVRVRAGARGVLRRLDLDWPRQEIVLWWERDGGTREELRFALRATEGPRNGHMREFFEVEQRGPSPDQAPTARLAPKARARDVAVPALAPDLIVDPRQRESVLQRVWALAHAGRFPEAEEQLRVLTRAIAREGELESLASEVAELAVLYRDFRDEPSYGWLRGQALNLWYAWGSQATAGGEGAVRGGRICSVEARLPAPGGSGPIG